MLLRIIWAIWKRITFASDVLTLRRLLISANTSLFLSETAAGRVTPYVGLTFNGNVLREQDMLTLGAFSPDEVHEDVEISFVALEHRFPNLEKRASPVHNQAAFS